MDEFEGKVAVITGAACGIGEGAARRFVEEGASVVVSDLQVEAGEALAKNGYGQYLLTLEGTEWPGTFGE